MMHPVDRKPTNRPAITLMQFTATDSVGDYKILVLLIHMLTECLVPHIQGTQCRRPGLEVASILLTHEYLKNIRGLEL